MTTIRLYRDADFVAVAALEESGVHEPYRSAVFVRQMVEVCKETFLVAVTHEGEPVGYTVGILGAAQFSRGLDPAPGSTEDQRRKGTGGALLTAVTGALQAGHADTLRLTVSLKNQPAIRLYKRQGFCQEKTMPAYFGPGEDRIIMKKTLNGC
jgi:ribosomal protein S18 acetylase RimI-like enzyme